LIDYKTSNGDPGCADPTDSNERGGNNVCDDGLDNDNDGRADFRTDGAGDPGCASALDDNERCTSGTCPQCDDTIDNDNDDKIDYPDDPHCAGPDDVTELGDFACSDLLDN